MSVAANKAKGRRSYDETMDLVRGRRAAAGTEQAVDGLTADQWERLACLMGYSQPSSRWAETAVQPMVVFPAKCMMTGHALIDLHWRLSHVPWRSIASSGAPVSRGKRQPHGNGWPNSPGEIRRCHFVATGLMISSPSNWAVLDHRSAAHLGSAVFVADAALDAASLTYIAGRLQQADRQVPALGTT